MYFPFLALSVFFILWIEKGYTSETLIPIVPRTITFENHEFDASFLNIDDDKVVDLGRFAHDFSAIPGIYNITLYINNRMVRNVDIEFKARSDKTIYPCLTLDIIKNIEFNYEKLPSNMLNIKKSNVQCLDLQRQLSDTQITFDSNELRLDILIPQIYMLNTQKGTVNAEFWDSGVPAFLLNYNINGYTSKSQGNTFNSFFSGVNSGLNMGQWYLRHNGSYSWLENGESQYNNINTYLQRDVAKLNARVIIGQSNTTGELFDTLPFNGIQLVTDERMLPESKRGYAPDIYGTARTNARVIIRQSGQIIYETTVTPGKFIINDLYPMGYGGDLDVTVRESDGIEQTFSVPYSSIARLLRTGVSRYDITVGEVRSDNLRKKPSLYQITYQRGLANSITGYGGLQASKEYYALQLGTAIGVPVGAFAFDITEARTQLGAGTNNNENGHSISNLRGQSYKVSYSKLIRETNSNLSLAAYRFSTEGYMDFMTALQTRDAIAYGYSLNTIWRAKSRLTLTTGQGLPENWGQLYFSGSLQNYWNHDETEKQYQLGYNNSYRELSYGFSINRSFSSMGSSQTNYLLSFSLPLGRYDNYQTPQLRMDLAHDSKGYYGQQVSISGNMKPDSRFSYGITAMNSNQYIGSSGSLSGNYRGSVTALSSAMNAGKGYHSAAIGIDGSLVVHSDGVTFSPYISDNFALIEAKGAEGARVSSYSGVNIDAKGYALVPNLTPYQINEINIDPKGIPFDTEMDNTSLKVAPYSGAVVKLKYNTKRGRPILINAIYKGKSLPFGANILDAKGNSIGAVGQGGQLYARVIEEQGQLTAKWGESRNMQCVVNYTLPSITKERSFLQIHQFDAICR